MPLLNYNSESKTKRQGLATINDQDKRFLEAGQLEIQDRLASSTLFRPERYIEDMTDEDYIQVGKERVKKESRRTVGGTLKDIAVTGAKGVVGLGEAVVGLADIPTLGRVGKGMEKYLGYDPEATKEFLGEFYSPAQKAAFEEVEKAKGFVGTAKEMVKHPSVVGHAIIESAPQMLGGAAAARKLVASGLLKMTPVWNNIIAASMGEGLVSAGATAEGIRQQTKEGVLTAKQAAVSMISGAGTAMFALAGGRVAQKFGIIDPDTFLAGGSNVTTAGVIKRIIGGGISEGAFEELPQSMQEQVWLNAALDKSLLEGVGEAGATGLLTGMAMGAGFNVFTGKPYTKEDIAHPTETAAKQQTTTIINNMIDEGMTTGAIAGQPFTPETAIEVIRQAYTDKTLTDENIDQFKEKYPALRSGLNEIIGDNVAGRVSMEIQDAEKVRRKAEEASIKERADREAEERLYLRAAEKDRLEAKEREIAGKKPEIIKPKPRHEMTLDEFVEETRRFEIEDGMSPEEAKKTITRETEMDSHKRRMLYAIEQGKKLPQETLREYSDDPRFAKVLAEIEPKKAKPISKKVYTGDIKFTGMQHIKGEPSIPLFVTPEGGQVEYDSAKHKITNLAEYEKAIKPEKVEKVIKPEVEIPILTDTTQAIEFGKKATLEQITELKRLRKESEARYGVLVKEGNFDEAGREAFKAQLYREAFEVKEKPKEPVIEKEVVEKEISETLKAIRDNLDNAFIELDEGNQEPLQEAIQSAASDIELEAIRRGLDERGINPDRYLPKTPYSPAKPKTLAIEEMEEAIEIEKPAKPITPKPPEPTPPVAVEEEIKVEPIPEVAPVKAYRGEFKPAGVSIPTDYGYWGKGKYYSLDKKVAQRYAKKEKVQEVSIDISNFVKMSVKEANAAKFKIAKANPKLSTEEVAEQFGKDLKKEGYDGFILEGKDQEIVVYTPEKVTTAIKTEVKPKIPTKPKPGFAWIKGKQKPILSAREITKGKNKGKYEVTLTKGRDAEGNIIPGVKSIVEEKAIIKRPEATKEEAMPTKKPKEEKKFAAEAIKPQDTITRQDLQNIFGEMKNLRTGVNPTGNFYFKVEGRPAVEILEVDSIGGYINTDKGRIPVGSYLKNTIELKTTGIGPTADIATAFHEYMHFLERNGIITPNDIKALDRAIGKAEVTEEDRAAYVGDNLAGWKTQTNTRIKRILKKISDFANAVYEFFSRTRTAKGVLRDIETGKILAEKKEVVPIITPAEVKQFAIKPAVDYKELLERYKAETTKKAKAKTNRLGKITLDQKTEQGITATQEITDSPSSPEGFNMPSEGKGRQALDTIQWKMQDRLIHLKKVQAVIEKTIELPDSSNVYQTEELYHYKTTKRIKDADRDLFDPLTGSIAKSVHDLEDVELFLRARHAPEANKRLQEINPKRKDNAALSGMPNAEANKIMEQYGKDADMLDIVRQIDEITKATRQIMVNDGLATKNEIKTWENAYKYYIPLKREGKGSEMPKKGRGMYVGGKESKMRLTGSEDLKPINIVANIMAQHESTIIRAEKAKVGRAMLELAQKYPNKDLWIADAPELKPFLKQRKDDARQLDLFTGLPGALNEVVYGKDILYKFTDNVLVTKIDGIEHTVTFNEQNVHANRIVRSLKNLGADNSNAAINILSKVNRVLAMVNTSYNPEFIISNFARDIQTAGYNINDTEARNVKAKVFKDVGKAWLGIRQGTRGKYTTEWAKHYEAFEKSGAQTGWIDYYKNIEAREKTLKKKLAMLEEGNWPATKRAFKSVFEFIDNENTAVENAIRLSTYKHLKDIGISEARAASVAKNLTVNFNRRGDAGQALNALYLFFNANVQGSVRLLYAAAKSPTVRKMMLGTIGFAVMLDILNRSLGGEDDDGENKYDKVPTWVKEHNMVIMRPNGDYFKIPLPWGYNTLHVLGQVIGESVDPNYKKDFSAIASAGRVGGAVLASFNPLGSENSLLQIASPTIIDPFIQWSENQNFAGIPLRPEQNPFDVSKPEYQMYFRNAREPSKWITKQLNDLTGGDVTKPGLVDISPEVFDLFIDTFTGGAGRFIDNTLRMPKTLTEKDVDVRHIPFIRRMYGEPSEFAARTIFYDNLSDIRYSEKSVKHYQNIRDFDGLKKIRKEDVAELRFIERAKETKKEVDKLRKQQRQIEKSTLNKEIKEKRIEYIEKRIRLRIDGFNKQYFNAKHRRK